jgi:hypothetical protein
MRKTRLILLLLLASLGFIACKSKKEELTPVTPDQFVQLQSGKFIIYKLDSTVFPNSGRDIEHHRYQERHLVDSAVTDGLGRPSWRVFRSLRDSAGRGSWRPAGSYLLTLSNGNLELTEDNLRFLSLATPLRSGASWKGGGFLGSDPYRSLYSFGNDDNISDWNFTVTNTGETVRINGNNYEDVLTVKGEDETINDPVTLPSAFASRSLYLNQYARGIGLVYQNYILWEYQSNTGGGTSYYVGFGVERSILQHN